MMAFFGVVALLSACTISSLAVVPACGQMMPMSQLGTGTNAVASTNCGPATSCAASGASAYTTLALTQNPTTGKFSGTLTSNGCNGWAKDNTYNGVSLSFPARTPSCFIQTIPDKTYTAPAALNIFNSNGFSLRSGERIYSSMDAGFSGTQPVTCNAARTSAIGTCSSGSDVIACEHSLEAQCGTGNVNNIGLSDCGGHATPYHLHAYMNCDYDTSATTAGHSTLVGVMADGTGLYGKYESTGTLPTDLDACGGHYGPVPATTLTAGAGTLTAASGFSLTFPALTNVYHYHLSDQAPYVPACWGPVANLATAQALYSSASGANAGCTTTTNFCTSYGYASDYKLRCPPVRDQFGAKSNEIIPTGTCPACHGSCGMTASTSSGTSSATASGTGSVSAAGSTGVDNAAGAGSTAAAAAGSSTGEEESLDIDGSAASTLGGASVLVAVTAAALAAVAAQLV